ncbi:MAG: M23 family metallopeptidase [Candidatus Eisenbacteria bacterium]|nr:M23 family metallopeptidase [Candidatus Eisenbacteria bacterium]
MNAAAAAPAFDAPLVHAPLAGRLVLNGGFGEYRSGHFHAGVDLGTNHVVGKTVYAPLSGWIERVRTSGVGYGRSLYLHGADGRLLVFGHLDAFAGPLAAYVDSVQTATAQYEQDLWLPDGRFRVASGAIVAWSGESGAGGPHLHFEIRRGDMAYVPMRAGLAIADSASPEIGRVTLEPLDDTSYVERGSAPYSLRLGARPETLRVIGRVRAAVEAHDARPGVRGMEPWRVEMEWGVERVACEFDSLSWATDMIESEYVYDNGRITGDHDLVMWAPAGFRPRVMTTTTPPDRDAGTLTVRAGDPPRALRITARGVNGRVSSREIVLRPPPPNAMGPDTTRVGEAASGAKATSDAKTARIEYAALPGGWLRIAWAGAPAGSRHVRLGLDDGTRRAASFADGRWWAVIPGRRSAMRITGRDRAGLAWEQDMRLMTVAPSWWKESGGVPFDSVSVVLADSAAEAVNAELVPAGAAPQGFLPASAPLRKPIRVGRVAPPEAIQHGGIYRFDGGSWELISRTLGKKDGSAVFTGESHHLGTFAVLIDTLAPRIETLRPPRRAGTRKPYARWALAARLTELGSGIDPRASRLEVDGRPVPSEWDPEARVLRWRPRTPPGRGVHPYEVVAADRAGNVRRVAARFIMN